MQSDTLLLRQIHPNWVKDNRAASVAFLPTKKDEEKLSVSNGARISPQAAWEKHTQKYQSEGTMAVTVDEVEKQTLVVEPAPLPDQKEHVHINFVNLETPCQIKTVSKMLALQANSRGWLYRKS